MLEKLSKLNLAHKVSYLGR